LFIQGLFGAFDTIFYHEIKAKLPALGSQVGAELRLHAARDFVYTILFGTLPWFAWNGIFAFLLALLLVAEIIITMCDFVVEDHVRKPLGGVYPGERVTHGLMAISYGAVLAYLVPHLIAWSGSTTTFSAVQYNVPIFLCWAMTAMAAGVFLSGIRDLCASMDLPGSSFPWTKNK
jgi:hypothetical protein